MNSILLIFAMIITYPSALPKDRRLIRVVEAELMHSSQGEHHPCGTEADPSSPARLGSCRSRSVAGARQPRTLRVWIYLFIYLFSPPGWWECVRVYPWEDRTLLSEGMHT